MSEQLEKFAKQAKLLKSTTFPNLRLVDDDELEHFAQLVRDDERERVCNILISGDCDGSVKAYIRKILEQGAENQ